MERILIIGIGNPGRRDDGLGAEAVTRLEARGLAGIEYETGYQLNIEDGLTCSEHDLVVFIDAARGLDRAFSFEPMMPSFEIPAISHALSPAAVLAVAASVFGKKPEAWVLAVRGRDWDEGEGLSADAARDLDEACSFLDGFLRTRNRPG